MEFSSITSLQTKLKYNLPIYNRLKEKDKMKKITWEIIFALSFIGMLTLAFDIKPVGAIGTIYIRADGSVDPAVAPVSSIDNITYTLTDNIHNFNINVERDDVIVDGASFTVQGPGTGIGVTLYGSNVTIKNMEIVGFETGFWLNDSSNFNTIIGNKITTIYESIYLSYSSNNTIIRNIITTDTSIPTGQHAIRCISSSNNIIAENDLNCNSGIGLMPGSDNNSIFENNITAVWGCGFDLRRSSNNQIYLNDITAWWCALDIGTFCGVGSRPNIIYLNNIRDSKYGIFAVGSRHIIFGNNITNNVLGIYIENCAHSSKIYHNNIINNTEQAFSRDETSIWDDGYPSGGNYWSDYSGVDLFWGPYQNITESDGIGDSPHFTDTIVDRYPLMNPWTLQTFEARNIAMINVTTPKTIVGQEFTLNANVTVANLGKCVEIFNVTLYINATAYQMKCVNVKSNKTAVICFALNTTDFAKGSYMIWAYAWPVPDEIDITDNTKIGDTILVTVPGDVNGDYTCDMTDLSILIEKFFAEPNHPRWQPNCDLNDDLLIDMVDISILIRCFLKNL
jgi:parallel beta-helix repeat protein